MAKKAFIGNSSGKAQKITKIYIGSSDEKAHKIKAAYIGDSNGKARKFWPNSILPEEYQWVEYIMNNGGQIIDTGIKANSDTRLIVDMEVITVEHDNQTQWYWSRCAGYFGASGWTFYPNGPTDFVRGTSYCFQSVSVGSDKKYARLLYNGGSGVTFSDKQYLFHRYIYDINRSGGNSYINDELVMSSTETFSDTEGNVSLFAASYYSTAHNQMSYASSGQCKIYQFTAFQNNTLVRNMYPCYRKSDNVVGMYDIVHGVFYTNISSSSNPFYKGPNVVE